MSITSYATLQTAIGDFLNRDDLTSVAPTFIQLAEAQISRDVRHWRMETRAEATIDAGDDYIQIPNDWVETIRINLSEGDTYPLDLISRAALIDKRSGAQNTSGRPRYYTHADSQFRVYPTPDADYAVELLYYAAIPALSDGNPVNWLLTYAPDIYLYGSLVHSAPYLVEDARTATWSQLYAAAVLRLNEESESARMSGSGLTMKVRGLG